MSAAGVFKGQPCASHLEGAEMELPKNMLIIV